METELELKKGLKFYTGDGIEYTLGSRRGDIIKVEWKEGIHDSYTRYALEDVKDYFKHGSWKPILTETNTK